jgi:Undecaprenyl-phosphate glucose phosphotransferase
MNEIDPSSKFSSDTIKAFAPDDVKMATSVKLNPMAEQVAHQFRADSMSPVMVSGVVRLVELAMLSVSGFIIYALYVGAGGPMNWEYPAVLLCGAILMVLLLEMGDAYQVPSLRRPGSLTGRIIASWIGVFATLALTGFFLKISEEFSRVWFGSWFVCGLVLIFGFRFPLASFIRRWGRNGRMERRAVIVGGGKYAESLIRSLEQQSDNDIRICGIFDDRDDQRSPTVVAGYPKLGTIAELIEFARLARIDMLIVAMPLTAETRVLSMLKKLWVLPVDIRLSAHSNKLQFRPRAYSHIGSVPLLDIFDKPIRDWDSVAKRMFDIVFSILGIIALSPIMLATAIAIKMDSKGPVLFRQKRHGFNNEVIDVLKFRSMYVEASDPLAKRVVTKGDPRVTRVGRFIRKASIDELPQFFNALRGDLSLVGPRPHAVYAQTRNRMFNDVVEGYFARHKVKPGVTGWAQINGWRGEIDSDDKIKMRTEYDLHYIENWSLWFDLKILFLTPLRLMNTENAY